MIYFFIFPGRLIGYKLKKKSNNNKYDRYPTKAHLIIYNKNLLINNIFHVIFY